VKNGRFSTETFLKLRERAEQLLKEKGIKHKEIEADQILHLAHELEMYQVELELQNEELRSAKAELETLLHELFDLYESAPVPYVTLDEKGFIQRVNKAASRFFLANREIQHGDVFLAWIHPEDIPIYASLLQVLAMRQKPNPVELRVKGAGNKTLYAHVEASARIDEKTKKRNWCLAFVDITPRKNAEQKLELLTLELEQRIRERTEELNRRNEQLARLSSQLTLAEQLERRRIAEVLHDHVQQLMVGAKMGQELMIPGLSQNLKPEAAHVLDLINRSIRDLRSLGTELSPPVLHSGNLVAILEWLARSMRENFEFNVSLESKIDRVPDRKDINVLLFKSVRELLFNAIKHAGVKSAVLKMEQTNGELRITVSDRGVGFDPEQILAENDHDQKFGLISIRERLLHMGGRFEVESAPGSGSIFSLLIPLEEDEAEEAAQPNANGGAREEHARVQPAGKESAEKIRVMLVDDHPIISDGLAKILGPQSDIELVGQAFNGEEAVELARETVPDVILMDINMPRMNGLEATRIIHSEFPHIRIIGLSAYNEHELAGAMMAAGASAFQSKTDTKDLLLAAIRGESES